MNPKKTYAVLSALILFLSACGGDADQADTGTASDAAQTDTTVQEATGGTETETTSAPVQPETTVQSDQGDSGSVPDVTEMGSFVVDGTEFAVTFLNRCVPFSGPDSDEIDLQPIAQGQGAQLNLYGTQDSLEVSVQGGAVEEIGGTNSFAADPFGNGEIRASSIDGDRWTGEATLNDSYGSDATVAVSWDVMIPEEINDCGL